MKKIYIAAVLLISIKIMAEESISTEVMVDARKEKLFNQIIKDEFSHKQNPLPEQDVIDIKNNIDDWKRKQNTRVKDPEILNRSFSVSFEPKTRAEELYFSPNYTTTVIFLDKLGNAWPITKYIIGNSSKFQIEQVPPSTLIITPLVEYAYGNLTVMFEDKSVPAIFTIKTTQDLVDYKVEARINEIGPITKSERSRFQPNQRKTVSSSFNPHSFFPEDDMTNLLNGEPPQKLLENKKTAVGRSDIEIYEHNEKLYILTKGVVRTPEPIDSRQSANGRNLFVVVAMPYFYLVENGELIKIEIRD